MKKILSLLFLTLVFSTHQRALAQTSPDICTQAAIDAKSDVKSWLWIGAGCVFNLLGVGAAYLYKPVPPPERLLGKSPEYVDSYTECYTKQARRSQADKAWIGCGVSGGVSLVAGTILIIALVNEASTSCSDAAGDACGNACGNMASSACSRGWPVTHP